MTLQLSETTVYNIRNGISINYYYIALSSFINFILNLNKILIIMSCILWKYSSNCNVVWNLIGFIDYYIN